MITKDRVVNVLGVAGAIFCLVMILAGPGQAEEDDDGPPAQPATSQVAPAPGVAPAAPGQSRPAAPPAQQQPADDDGDDDDG